MTAWRDRLVLFAKEPVPGRAKTRLAAALGRGPAAILYAAFLEDLSAALGGPWEAVVAHDGADRRLREIFREPWSFRAQGGGDLGARLARATRDAFEAGRERVVLAGSDAPTLAAREVAAAFAALGRADVALAPAPDGGFTLAALGRRVDPTALFGGVRWSTDRALADVEQAAAGAGLRVEFLGPVPDVDVVADLIRLLDTLEGDPSLAPATRRALATHREVPVG